MTRNHLLTVLICLLAPIAAQANYFTEREDVQAFIHDLAQRQSFSPGELNAAFESASPIPKVIELIRPPANPGIRSWERYRARFIDSTRISGGIQFWRAHQKTLTEAEARSGVPAEIIVALIGVETVYGRNTGSFSALSALATLAFDYPPRADLFRRELEALLILAREQGRDVRDYRGSYAGALGLPQFLPSSIRNFAVDGDQDNRIDLLNSPVDAIFSVANFLVQHGWQRGGQLVLPARVSDEALAQSLIGAGIQPMLNAYMLNEANVRSALPSDSQELVALVDLVTPGQATQYWLGFQNFYVITRYNRSSFYAMSVRDLALALRLEFDARRDMAQMTNAPDQGRSKLRKVPRGKPRGA